MVRRTRWLLSCLLCLCVVNPLAAAVDVTIDRNPVRVNESFQLVFSLDDNPPREPDFSVLQQHFLVLANNRNNSISIINGDYQRSVKWTLQLMAKQIGEYTIPAIRFGDEQSEPFKVTVEASSLGALPHDQQVLEVLVDRNEVYVQGQVVLTMRLLSATDIAAYEFARIPAEDLDVVVEPLGDPRQYRTRIADRSYLVLEQQYALFPQKSGPLEIPALAGEVRLRSRSSFDPFNTGGAIRRLLAQPVSIDVRPIPAEMAGSFWLPARHVELREKWPDDLTGLIAGEPITRSIVIMADGLTAAQLPEFELQAVDGIKQYPDQPVMRNDRGDKGVRGQRGQKVALIPAAAGIYRIPEISVPWWNIASGRVETATLPARELYVGAAPQASTAPSSVAPAATAAEPQAAGGASRFWVWLSLLLGIGWAGSGLLWWWRARPRKGPAENVMEVPGLGAARRALQRACRENDAVAARVALLYWGQAVLAPRPVANLDALARTLGPEFREQLNLLNRSLYAPAGGDWQGEALLALCQRLDPAALDRRANASTGLAPLNP